MSTARGEAGTSVARARDLVFVRLRRFDVGDYHRLGKSGVLSPEDRVELIDGEIVEMTPIGSRHADVCGPPHVLFSGRTGSKAVVFVQSPIRLGRHSEPQPDLAILDPGTTPRTSLLPETSSWSSRLQTRRSTSTEESRRRSMPGPGFRRSGSSTSRERRSRFSGTPHVEATAR